MKVLYNRCYGGFSFSTKFVEEFNERNPNNKLSVHDDRYNGSMRTHPDVIALFEEKGSKWSSGGCAKLEMKVVPDDVEYKISEYDGVETISWDIPKHQIIQDLVDIIKGRKKEEETSKFTQMMLQEDLTPKGLRDSLISNQTKRID